jgi:hypothetical protein
LTASQLSISRRNRVLEQQRIANDLIEHALLELDCAVSVERGDVGRLFEQLNHGNHAHVALPKSLHQS